LGKVIQKQALYMKAHTYTCVWS